MSKKLRKLSDEEVWTRWNERMTRVRHELHHVYGTRKRFNDITGLFEKNHKLKATGGDVYEWMFRMWARDIVIAIRRELDKPARVLATWVTGHYFPLLDVRPALGRMIRDDEGAPGRVDAFVVFGYSTWQRRFAGDPSVVGGTVMVNGRPCTIVGVAPPDFSGTFAFSESELFLPLNWRSGAGFDDRQDRGLHAIARLRPGVTIDKAQAVMNVLAQRLSRRYPDSNANLGIRVLPERLARPKEDQFRTNALGAAVMVTMVVLVMIVAAVNVTNLLLARAASRQREVAIRSALGAGRGRLVRQMVTESLVLAMLGGGAGVLLGTWVVRALAAVRLPGDLRCDSTSDWMAVFWRTP